MGKQVTGQGFGHYFGHGFGYIIADRGGFARVVQGFAAIVPLSDGHVGGLAQRNPLFLDAAACVSPVAAWSGALALADVAGQYRVLAVSFAAVGAGDCRGHEDESGHGEKGAGGTGKGRFYSS